MPDKIRLRRRALGAVAAMLGVSVVGGLLATVAVAPAVAVTGVTASAGVDVFDDLPNYIQLGDQAQRNTIWANRDGQPVQIATLYSQNREVVSGDAISDYAREAAVSGEDRNFDEHNGVDVARITAAAIRNVTAGDVLSGASTITMQLVKNIFVMQSLEIDDPEERQAAYEEANAESISRKIQEARYAIALEQRYTKDEILEAYLNIAYYGDQTYGIEAAAQQYYATTAAELTPAQAASLVAIVQYPGLRSLDDPEHYDDNQERRDQILTRMFEDGYLDQARYDEAIATPVDETTVTLTPSTQGCTAAEEDARLWCAYVDSVASAGLIESMGATTEERAANWERGGYDLYTTLDLDLTAVAQEAQRIADPTEDEMQLGAASASVEVGTGRILQISQNMDYSQTATPSATETQLNYAVDQQFGATDGAQPGSTMKPFTLLAWIAAGHSLTETVSATERSWAADGFTSSCWDPDAFPNLQNDANESGTRTVRQATVSSVNNAYMDMATQLDLCDIRDIAESLGVHGSDGSAIDETSTSWLLGGSQLEVTPLTMAATYAAIANGGVYCTPIAVDRVVTSDGTELAGQTSECTQSAVDADVTHGAIDALESAVASYGGYPSDVFGKTGTTSDAGDTWVDTSSSRVATAQWVGNRASGDDRVSLRTVTTNGVRADQLRHVINREIQSYLDDAYPAEAFPAADWSELTGSADGGTVQIPTGIVGTDLAGAEAALGALGLTLVDGGEVASDAPEGTVVSTSPSPGSRVAPGSSVTVTTSSGEAPAPEPEPEPTETSTPSPGASTPPDATVPEQPGDD